MTEVQPAAGGAQPRGTGRVIVASVVGTSLEWYDFFLYGTAAALVFNVLFFPSFDPLTGTLLAFATYAVGFVSRPLGGRNSLPDHHSNSIFRLHPLHMASHRNRT